MASHPQNVLPKLLAKLEIASFKPLQGGKAILFGDGRCGGAVRFSVEVGKKKPRAKPGLSSRNET
jgi:hypothetical protein